MIPTPTCLFHSIRIYRIRFKSLLEGYIQKMTLSRSFVSAREGHPEKCCPPPVASANRTVVMAQSWHDLLFAHWPVDAAILRPLLPPQLQIDTFEGHAWLAVVPFRMTDVRLRGAPRCRGSLLFPN